MDSRLINAQKVLQKRIGRKEELEQQLVDERARFEKQEKRVAMIERCAAMLQQIATDMNNEVSISLTDITQAMVDSVFPGEYKVKMDFNIKAGRTHVDIYLDMDGTKIYPLDDDGGGVSNMMELGLRLAALKLGKSRRTLVLDQPFKDLSVEYLPLAGKILRKISKDLKLQMIIINHIEALMGIADRTFQFRKDLTTKRSQVKVVNHEHPE